MHHALAFASDVVVLPNGAVVGGALPTADALALKLRELGIHERTREEREAEIRAAFGEVDE